MYSIIIGMKIKDFFIDLAKGASLGAGLLPGVSAGTVGLIVNIYDKLISGINDLKKNFLRAFLTLLPIGIGWVASGILLLYVQHKCWDYIPFIIVCICTGFLIGGMPTIYKESGIEKINKNDGLRMAIGFIIATLIGVFSVLAYVFNWFSFEEAFANPNQNWWVYIVIIVIGFVAAAACIIPGISGAMILFIFGLYQPVLNIYFGDNSIIHNHDRLGSGLLLTLCLAIGVVLGFLAISKVMKSLLEKHKRGTYGYVLGFIAGSIVAMFINNQIWPAYSNPNTSQWYQYLIGIILLIAIAIATLLLIKLSSRKKKENLAKIKQSSN